MRFAASSRSLAPSDAIVEAHRSGPRDGPNGALQLKVQPQGIFEVGQEVGWHSAEDRTDPFHAN